MRASVGFWCFTLPVCIVPSFEEAHALIHRRSAALLGTSGGVGSLDLSQMLAQGVSGRSRLSQSHAWFSVTRAKGLSGAEMRAVRRARVDPDDGGRRVP